ncbi:conserved exported hypothetical protein [Flavobacterium sp. 9AF]|uniref:S41 family peptidase n=1 Tax=Flavobacterium sp. 9AF TaxID=2653142 RepID=UPI0012F11529|nr:S41 family peptidase [Flavobacterium sp. 9AF]VXB59509.1 conserved exported hypothetical protein [Flavobacterium sp. 9AF]
MKNYKMHILIVLLLSFTITFQGQNSTSISNLLKDTPSLTTSQMLVDYDSLVSYINQVSPIVQFNKEVRNIDFNKHAKKIRSKINSKTTKEEYLFLIEKTLNAAQDGHSNRLGRSLLDIVKTVWIPQNIVTGIDTSDFVHSYKYDKYIKDHFYTKSKLELVYIDGDYYNLLPFSYKGKEYPASMKLISCNNQKIHSFVKNMEQLISPLRWDRVHKKVYNETFYTVAEIYNNDVLKFTFQDPNKQEKILELVRNDTVTFLEDKKNSFGYNNNLASVITHYFEKEKIFYAKLPAMEEKLGDTLIHRFQNILNHSSIKSIVLDVRGNGGGSDYTYGKFLGKIIKDTLQSNVVVGRIFSSLNCKYFEMNKDSIVKYGLSLTKDGIKLKNLSMFYNIIPNYSHFYPEKETLPFEGNIYLLQDRFIYSATSNLSSLAYKMDRIISIGETPNLLGGMQSITSVFCLPYSKVIFRIEPQIDFTDCKTTTDLFQNQVEHFITYSIDFLHERTITEEAIFGKNFLIQKDPMFKKVLEIENQ